MKNNLMYNIYINPKYIRLYFDLIATKIGLLQDRREFVHGSSRRNTLS